ncbi:MAG TPA: PEP-CTERM sorting domain-containing protein [Methylomirabilota bacterium]|jgi:hypothetical protein
MFTRLLILGFTAALLFCSSDAFAMGGGRGRGGGSSHNNSAPQSGGGSTYDAYQSSGWNENNLREDGSWTSGNYNGQEGPLTHAPEPGTLLMLASGAAGVISWRRRRKK